MGCRGVRNSLVFWVVFLGNCLNTKERKIRVLYQVVFFEWWCANCRNQGRKYEKITKKKNTKSPTPGWAPKIRKNYQKNTKMVISGAFLYFFGNFFVFSGPNPGWGILFFS